MQISLEKQYQNAQCKVHKIKATGIMHYHIQQNTFSIKQTQNSTYVYNIKTRLQYTKNPYAHSIIRTLGSYLTPHPNES